MARICVKRQDVSERLLLEGNEQDVRVEQCKIWRVRGRDILCVLRELIVLHDYKKAERRH